MTYQLPLFAIDNPPSSFSPLNLLKDFWLSDVKPELLSAEIREAIHQHKQ